MTFTSSKLNDSQRRGTGEGVVLGGRERNSVPVLIDLVAKLSVNVEYYFPRFIITIIVVISHGYYCSLVGTCEERVRGKVVRRIEFREVRRQGF